ncbi:hypothetical protein [uncultured Draconibacterium sp.]|uniref:hypothetical protein n=1 Tax=uncultured Draconibacterium sp. TaxID=1573823 RepID=UPI0029C95C2D|nr:hypothetical protein [uncultured Draconibacterium sp.]
MLVKKHAYVFTKTTRPFLKTTLRFYKNVVWFLYASEKPCYQAFSYFRFFSWFFSPAEGVKMVWAALTDFADTLSAVSSPLSKILLAGIAQQEGFGSINDKTPACLGEGCTSTTIYR